MRAARRTISLSGNSTVPPILGSFRGTAIRVPGATLPSCSQPELVRTGWLDVASVHRPRRVVNRRTFLRPFDSIAATLAGVIFRSEERRSGEEQAELPSPR